MSNLKTVEQRLLWLSHWMIHSANHIRPKADGIKVGGQRAAFAEPGGDKLQAWIDGCPNQLYAALTYMGGAVWRKYLMDDLGDQGDVTALLDARSDTALAVLMENLGGNCVDTMAETFAAIDHDRPVCFLAYTIKGWGTPIAGHNDNHGGLIDQSTDGRLAGRYGRGSRR